MHFSCVPDGTGLKTLTFECFQLFLSQPLGKRLRRGEVRLTHWAERALMHASTAQRSGIDKIDTVIKKPETFSDQKMAIQHRHTLIESGAFAPQFQDCKKDNQETSEQALEKWWSWKTKQNVSMRATAPEFVPSHELQTAVDAPRFIDPEPPRDQFVPKRERTNERATAAQKLGRLRKGPGPYAAPTGNAFAADLGQFVKYTILKREQ